MKRIVQTGFVLLGLLVINTSSCANPNFKKGNPVTVTRNVDSYSALDLSGAYDFILTNDDSHQIKIGGGENVLKYIETTVKSGTLIVKETEDAPTFFANIGKVKIYIPAQKVYSITLNGSGDVETNNFTLKQTDFELNLNGSGNVGLAVVCKKMSITGNGSGDINLKGSANMDAINLSGSGDLNLFDFKTDSTQISLAGSGQINIFAHKYLGVAISGSGEVAYKGNPKVEQSIIGSGSVKPY